MLLLCVPSLCWLSLLLYHPEGVPHYGGQQQAAVLSLYMPLLPGLSRGLLMVPHYRIFATCYAVCVHSPELAVPDIYPYVSPHHPCALATSPCHTVNVAPQICALLHQGSGLRRGVGRTGNIHHFFLSAIKFLAQVHTIQLLKADVLYGASYPPSQPRTLT